MKTVLLGIAFLSFFLMNAQEKEARFNELLLQKINKLRAEQQLPLMEEKEVLNAVAFDQAEYIDKLGKVTHEQTNSKSKTLSDRIRNYEGLFATAGENASIIGFDSKEILEVNGSRVQLKSEDDLIQAVLVSWLKDEESKRNLLDDNFYNIGISTIIDESEYTIVVIFASLEYENDQLEKLPVDLYGIKPYKKEICSKFLENYPSLPQLFSDAIKVEGNEAYFTFHDLTFIQNILSGSDDGLALDVIANNQFDCKSGNRLFPTDIADGYLLRPINRSRLNVRNLEDSIKKVKVSLGELPSYYSAKEHELNMIVVKDGYHCETVPFNTINTTSGKIIETPFLLAGYTEDSIITWIDSSYFVYNGERSKSWQNEWEKDAELLREFNYKPEMIKIELTQLKKVDTTLSFDASLFMGLTPTFSYRPVWKEVDAFVKNSFYQLDMAKMNHSQKVDYLDSVKQKDERLRLFLDSLQSITIKLRGKAELPESIRDEESLLLLKKLIDNKHLSSAIYLQADLIAKVKKGSIPVSKVPITDPPQVKFTLPLINNQIILNHFSGEEVYYGNPLHLAFLELYLIDKQQKEINYNYHLALLKHWAKERSEMKGFEGWLKGFSVLSTSHIKKEDYARVMLGYNMLAVDYYFEKANFNARKKAFSEIIKWQAQSELKEAEVLELAKFLCVQDQFPMAASLLKVRLKKEAVGKETIFFYLQIATYNQKEFSEEAYFTQLEKASVDYPAEFCELFSKEKMGIQSLKQPSIKKLYCEKCN